jgi:arylsulfatase A-like enzyme
VLLGASTVSAAAAAPRPNIIIIVLDTLRYDATSLGDSTGTATPFLASLQSRGIVFTHAYSTHDFTPPSHFSILTGLRDGLGTDADQPENSVIYQLGQSGYATFATVANGLLARNQMPVLRPTAALTEVGEAATVRGTAMDNMNDTLAIQLRLALFGCPRTTHTTYMLFFSASRLLPAFLDQIRAANAPSFGFVNLVDPHEPYVPDPATYKPEGVLPPNFSGDPLQRRLGPELANPDGIADPQRRFYIKDRIRIAGSPKTVATDLPPEALAVYRNRYLAKVRTLDDQLRQFFAVLEAEHRLDDTVVVITADHGESFGEAGLITHNFHDRGDYESTHHVPLLIVLPPRYRVKKRRIEEKVTIADITPTLYDLAGVDWQPMKNTFGDDYARSLAPLFMTTSSIVRVAHATPLTRNSDHSAEELERRAAMQSLGYAGDQ